MPHPYIIKRTEISGFFGFVCLFGSYVALTSDSIVARLRDRFLPAQHPAPLHIAGVVLLVLAVLLLGFAIYSQWPFGPRMSSVSAPIALWPPRDFRARFGVAMFILVLVLMGAIVFAYLLFTIVKTSSAIR
jgi:hypothetical protein